LLGPKGASPAPAVTGGEARKSDDVSSNVETSRPSINQAQAAPRRPRIGARYLRGDRGRDKPASERVIFILRLRPEPKIDAHRALRAALKSLLRHFGLRAISVEEMGS
jgi:hypothetical protein